MVAVVPEGDIAEADCPARAVPGLRRGRLGDGHRRIEQFEDALASRQEAGQPGGEVRERPERGVEHRQVCQECDQLAEGHLPGDHVAAADIPDDQAAEPEHDLHRRGVGGIRVFHPQSPVGEMVACGAELLPLPRLLGEGLHHADAGEHPGEGRHLLARGIPQPVVPWVDVLPEDPRPEDHQRHRNEGEQREFRVDPDEHRPDPHQLHDLEEEAAGDLVHQSVEHLAVVSHAADHRAHLMPVVVGDRQVLEFVHHLLTERAGEPRADGRGEPAFEHADDREDDP